MEGPSPHPEETAACIDRVGGVQWRHAEQKDFERAWHSGREPDPDEDRSRSGDGIASVQSCRKRMEHLLVHGPDRNPGCPGDRRFPGWMRRILLTGSLRGPAHLQPFYLVQDHGELCAVGTGVFRRWR